MLLKNITSCSMLFLLVLVLTTKCFGVADMNMSTEISSSGGMLKAGSLAYAKFNDKLTKIEIGNDASRFLSDIENYDVHFIEDGTSYSLTISPKPYKGRMLKGGGATYVYKKKDFKLIKEIYYK